MTEDTDDQPVVVVAVTGRPNDLKQEPSPPALANSTMASRRQDRLGAKAVDDGQAENKAISTPDRRTKRK